jgi:hypothetical protein
MSGPSIAAQVVALGQLNVAQLRERWREIFGEETKQRHRQFLIRRIAWELQRRESGEELSPEALKRLDELQDEFRNSPPSEWFKGARHNRPVKQGTQAYRKAAHSVAVPKTGTTITRSYKDQNIVVTVRGPREFEWNGEIYTSLSAAAKAITGSHCSGIAFFGLNKKGGV